MRTRAKRLSHPAKATVAGAVAVVLSLVAIASGEGERAAAQPVASAAAGGAKVKLMRTSYGRILVNGKGRALYLFDIDEASKSKCYGECARAWPPFHTAGQPRAGRGIKAKRLGTTVRDDGSSQVTYAGHPLYFYVGDNEPGEVLCQNVFEFGGRWLVVRRDGSPVR